MTNVRAQVLSLFYSDLLNEKLTVSALAQKSARIMVGLTIA